MKILLSNDDGIHAKGMRILYTLLQELGHEVCIVAPEHQASGSSHAITIATPLIPKKIWEGDRLYGIAINGLPCDAVRLGISSIYPDVDMVAAGINLGHNAGPAVFYSGTIAAASEGVMTGKPAMAFSFDSFHEPDLKGLEDKLRPFMPALLGLPKTTKFLYNINIPNVKIKGIRVARHFLGFYLDNYEKRVDPRGREYYWLTNLGYSPEMMESGQYPYPSDLEALEQGYIALTPLRFDWTYHEDVESLERTISGSPELSEGKKQKSTRRRKTEKIV
jgi:5'-nucleotidase